MTTSIQGYAGRFLRVDLTKGTIRVETLSERLIEYIGGLGIATRLFMDAYRADLKPEDDDNPFVLFTGPLTGTSVPMASRAAIVALSPQTRSFGMSNIGGFFGPVLKYAGFDGLILEGRSAHWVCLVIDGGEARLDEAEELVGKDTWDAQDFLAARLCPEHPEKVHVLATGPAGENGVGYASLTADYFNSASRCGLGSVMGQKRIKAIAVRDCGGSIAVADTAALRVRVQYALEKHRTLRVPFGLEGYTRFVTAFCEGGFVPHGNFAASRSPAQLPADVARRFIAGSANYRRRGRACHACPNSCFLAAEVTEGPYRGLKNTGAVPAAVLCWAGRCGIRTYEGVWKCEEVCDRLGLDMFSAAGAVSTAIDLATSGRVTRADAGGLALRWGEDAVIIELLNRVARVADDFSVLAGKGADALVAERGGTSATVKRLEMWGIDPRLFPLPYTIGEIFSLRGGDNIANTHNMHFMLRRPPPEAERAVFDHLQMPAAQKRAIFPTGELLPDGPRGIAQLVAFGDEFNTLLNCLGTCILEQDILHFSLGAADHYGGLYKAATGLGLDEGRIRRLCQRVIDLQRIVAANAGFTISDDTWPDRFFDEPIADGPLRGKVVDRSYVREAVHEYWELRGWSPETGRPRREVV